MVQAVRDGEPLRGVARRFGVSPGTVSFWVERCKGKRVDRCDFEDRPSGPHTPWNRTPLRLTMGDGALGFWAVLGEIYPETRQQRCWVHKTANVLNYLPKSLQPKAKAALHEIWIAQTRPDATSAFNQHVAACQPKYPKAVECLVKDREVLLTFYEFPAERWIHFRQCNAIASSSATIRHRTERTKGCLTRDGMLSMIFKLGMSAKKNWRRLRGFQWLGKVIDGVKLRDGIEVQQRVRKAGNQAPRRIAT